jgi:hypothetical protein
VWGCPKRGVWGVATPTCGGCYSPRILYLGDQVAQKLLFGQPDTPNPIPVKAVDEKAFQTTDKIGSTLIFICLTKESVEIGVYLWLEFSSLDPDSSYILIAI